MQTGFESTGTGIPEVGDIIGNLGSEEGGGGGFATFSEFLVEPHQHESLIQCTSDQKLLLQWNYLLNAVGNVC